MAETNQQTYKLMTYNIGGGSDQGTDAEAVTRVIAGAKPDILALQEVVRLEDFEGVWHSALQMIQSALGPGFVSQFASTLTLRRDFHTGKRAMVEALFRDDQDWQQGNALFSRWPFHRLGRPEQPGHPREVPLFRPATYQGNRDTDPRAALIARIGCAPHFPLMLDLHLTTLIDERGPVADEGRYAEARAMRVLQIERLLALLSETALNKHEVIFLMGDFNAPVDELAVLKQAGFVHLQPENESIGTHAGLNAPIDHLFVFPADRLVQYRCRVFDHAVARSASDHLPVVAEVVIR